jgi:probable rRNA maturation factor
MPHRKPSPAEPEPEPEPPPGGISVDVTSIQGHLEAEKAALAGLVGRVLRHEGIDRAAISLAIVDDAAIRRINLAHLGHDWPTDVISFGLSEEDDPELAGELVVSAEMARETAAGVGADPMAELSLYVVHGLLHLCGYDDTTDESRAEMRRREEEHLRREGLAGAFDRVERRRSTTAEA